MNAKTCPACGRVSYSSNTFSKWTCPYCNEDLTCLPLEPANNPKGRDLEEETSIKANG